MNEGHLHLDTAPPMLPSPPAWSLNLGEAGKALVILGCLAFLISAFSWWIAPHKSEFGKIGKVGFVVGCLAIFGTFAALATLFVFNRFEYEYVWGHADKRNLIPYRIAGVWSGQEGSFLLWATCAAMFGLVTVRGAAHLRRWYTIVYALFLGALCGILAFESPFNLNLLDGKPVVPEDGLGLAPSLQNYWVTIHPPTIFLGFGSLTVMFAFAMAALLQKDSKGWLALARPWAIVSMTLVGLGLCMGGFWAYETLGWGGFWMWDPVENVSFVPWVLTGAFIHGAMVQATRNKWAPSNLLMAALPFISFAYGTFLTRSGMLAETSVHSFAQMDSSALKILLSLLAVSVLGFLALWVPFALKNKSQVEEGDPKGWTREGFFRTGSLLFTGFAVATLVGMSVPFFMAVTGRPSKVVEEKLYHLILPYLFVPLMLAMAVAPFVSWRGLPPKEIWKKVYGAFCITFGLVGITMLLITATPLRKTLPITGTVDTIFRQSIPLLPWMLVLIGICLFVIVANTFKVVELAKRSKLGTAAFMAHIGVAVLMAGLIVSRGFERRAELYVQEGVPGKGLGFTFDYQKATSDLYDRDNKMVFDVRGPVQSFTATPGFYYVRQQDGSESPMVWPHIERGVLHDIYVTLHPRATDATEVVTLKPGEHFEFNGTKFMFSKVVRDGNAGEDGTRFGAEIVATADTGQSVTLTPTMRLGGGGVVYEPVQIGVHYMLNLKSMNVTDGTVDVQMTFAKPVYPIEVFFKPMTILVWLGTGLLTLAGFLAAWYRRAPRVVTVREEEAAEIPQTTLPKGKLVGAGQQAFQGDRP